AKALPDCEVEFDIKDNHCIIKTPTGKYKIPAENPDEYPMPEEVEGVELPPLPLKEVAHAMANDGLRRNMEGVYINCKKDKIEVVATDGFRMSKITTEHSISAKSCIVPDNVVKIYKGGTI